MVAKEMKPTSTNPYRMRQLYNIRKLNQKLITENEITFQADKGKTIVIIRPE
jgi:hypothetical protein